jgi:hypothetical protein
LDESSRVSCSRTVDVGVDLADGAGRADRLRPADVALAVDDLPLQVALVDDVELEDAERPHAGGGEVHQRG